jgi:hypothetical protein
MYGTVVASMTAKRLAVLFVSKTAGSLTRGYAAESAANNVVQPGFAPL